MFTSLISLTMTAQAFSVAEDVVQQRRLPSAEKAGQHGHGKAGAGSFDHDREVPARVTEFGAAH